MSKMDRSTKLRQSPALESLETRNLMSVLINAKPTLEVIPSGNRVREVRGAISIVQPTAITVTGTAQPPASNVQTIVQIFAKDSNGNLVNGGAPLGSAAPDFSGQYTTTLSLPSRLRRDVNTLFAREIAVGTLDSNVQINATTLAGLNSSLAISATTLAGLTGTISNPASTGTLNGTVITPATPMTGIGGTITTPAYPTNTGGVTGTAGPAVSTLVGGTGTLDTQAGTIVGGTITSSASTSTLTQNGTAAIASTTGSSTQTGTAAIAATTGASTQLINEVAVSEPITVLIHQSQRLPGATLQTTSKTKTAAEAGTRVHATTTVTPHAQTAQALRLAAARKRHR